MASNDYDDLLESFMNNSQKVYNEDKDVLEKNGGTLPTSYNTFSTSNKKTSPKTRKRADAQGGGKEKKNDRKIVKQKSAGKRAAGGIAKFLIALVMIACVVGVVCFSVIAIYGYSVVYGDKVFDLDSEKHSQNQTSFIYRYNDKGKPVEVTRLHGEENRIWLDLDDMTEYMSEAVIAGEDERFETHHGVDWKRTIGVTVTMSGQGGSTITQQLIKNLTDENSVTFVRKFNEILSALNIEKNYSKDDIIEAYLNTIYLSHGCYGVKTAAETYFGKDVDKLNAAECACLVAITKFPTKNDPILNPENNKVRQEWILGKMKELGYLTQSEYEEAVNYELIFTTSKNYKGSQVTKNKSDNKSKKTVNSYYTDYVIDEVIADLQNMGYSSKKARDMIYGGGLKIYCAVDKDVQDVLEDVYKNYKNMPDHTVQGAMVVMDYHGRILGVVGGTGKKTENRVLNRATKSKRQPGSTIKPLSVYAPALEKSLQDDTCDIYWSTPVKDAPLMKINGKWWPTNSGSYSNNMLTLQQGLCHSKNTISAGVLDKIGVDYSYEFITNRFHITSLDIIDRDYAPMATGAVTNGISPLEMTTAYQAFGNGGKYYESYAYYKIEDSQGNVIIEKKPEETSETAISENTAGLMNKILQTAMQSGTGASFRLSGTECFGKTGTTTDNKDRWFIGGTPEYLGGVWYGYDQPKAIRYYLSSNPCGTIWKTVMNGIYAKKGIKVSKFDVPDGLVRKQYSLANGKLCSGSGQWGWFDVNNLPGTTTDTGVTKSTTEEEDEDGGSTKKADDGNKNETTSSGEGDNSITEAKTTETATEPKTDKPDDESNED